MSILGKTTMRKELGDRISIKNMASKHLLAHSKHLERGAMKRRKENKLQTNVTLKEGVCTSSSEITFKRASP